MKQRISLIFCAIFASFGTLLASPTLASGTGAWTDISSLIPVRDNRPVWAMAFRGSQWVMTDGIDFYRGGHVWSTDGSTLTDLTAEVKQAGLSRVDDIVSDGATVIYLKNITSRLPNMEMLSHNGGVYGYPAGAIIAKLQSNEGIASMTGKNGTWAIVTTQGRVLFWNSTTNNTDIFLSDTSVYANDFAYSVHHGSPAEGYGYLPAFAVPVTNGWVIGSKQTDGNMRFWFRDANGSATDITSKLPVTRFVQNAFSNNAQALIVGSGWNPTIPDWAQLTDGSMTLDVSPTALRTNTNFDWKTAVATYDGDAWQLFSKKQALENSFTVSDQTRDVVLTAAGDGRGTVLLGGLVSTDGASGATSPLTAKLIKVTFTNANGVWPDMSNGRTINSANGPTIVTTGSPASFRVGSGGTFIYRVTASDPNGVDHIDIFQDGSRVKTCSASTCEFSTVLYANGVTSRTVTFNASATDRSGWSNNSYGAYGDVVTVDTNSNATAYTNNSSQSQSQNGISYWQWLEPSLTQLRRDQLTSFNVGTWSLKGIARIEMYVNGISRRVCDFAGRAYGNQTCATTIAGGDYPLYTSVSMNAKITDGDGATIWTNAQTFQVIDANGNYGYNNGYYYDTNYPGDVSTWITLDPTGSTLNRSQSVTLRTSAQASRGLERVEVYANGVNRRTCYMNRSTNQQSCDVTFAGTEWPSGTTVTFKSEAFDIDGRTAWSDTRTVTTQDDSTNYSYYDPYHYGYQYWNWSNQNNSTFNVYKSPNVNEINRYDSITYTGTAYDTDGLRRVEVLVNGNFVQSCDVSYSWNGTGPTSGTCSATINGYNYAGTTLVLSTRATDVYGNVTTSPTQTVYVRTDGTNNSSYSRTNTNGPTASWVWSEPERTDFAGSDRPTFKVGAWDNDGIRKIEIYQNNTLIKTCSLGRAYGNQECAVRVQPTTSGTSYAYVNAKITDGRFNTTWSSSKNYRFNLTTSTINPSGNTNFPYSVSHRGNLSVSSNRDGGYGKNDLITFNGYGSDLDGVRSIDLYVNGERVMTCSGTPCTVVKGPFPARTTVTYAATLTDYTGQQVSTGYKTIRRK